MAFNGSYQQSMTDKSETHFSAGVAGEIERSRMNVDPVCITAFNAGDIVPIMCFEVLPSDTFDVSLDFVIRQNTVSTPTMGQMFVDYFAFFVPNRIINQSSVSVFGENVYGSWTADKVSFAPLYTGTAPVQVPVGSVADYYGFPTQAPIASQVLNQCNDLKFRGYIEIYNEYFRDQNYQPPVPYSKLNVYEGFFDHRRDSSPYASVSLNGQYAASSGSLPVSATSVTSSKTPDNAFGAGAIKQAIFGNAPQTSQMSVSGITIKNAGAQSSSFDALGKLFKANKLHDYFTSVLPSPQKGDNVFIPVQGFSGGSFINVLPSASDEAVSPQATLKWRSTTGSQFPAAFIGSVIVANGSSSPAISAGTQIDSSSHSGGVSVYPSNLGFNSNSLASDLSISINDLRMAAAIQQIYEQLARSGSRYRSYVVAFFGLDVEDAFKDIPERLGWFRRPLDLFQTAQTSSSEEGSTPQGNLAAFGYTNSAGRLFNRTFKEHGYVHIFAVVRHKNLYSSFLSRDNFRMDMLDFYHPQLANISEQPVFAREIAPFSSAQNEQPFGYQEPWAEYRFIPDRVTGYMRSGISESLAGWNYSDPFDRNLEIANAEWLKSNSQEVMDRTLSITSSVAPQLRGQFNFHFDMERPMPVFGVPGMDTI